MKCHYETESVQSCLTLCNPMDLVSPGSSVHGILQARIPEWEGGKMEYTRVGSHSLLQGIFLIHGSNPGVSHCRQADSSLSEPPLKDATGNLGACSSHKIICSCNNTNHYLNLKASKLENDQISTQGEYKPNLN